MNLRELRWVRKQHRMMHQRRPDIYALQTHRLAMWEQYPDVPWVDPRCPQFTNKAAP